MNEAHKIWKDYVNDIREDVDFTQEIYEAIFRVRVAKKVGGDKEQTWAEVRSIPGVTIVTPFGIPHDDPNGTTVSLRVKFCCISAVELTPRVYAHKVLKRQMKGIEGLSVIALIGVSRL